MKLGEIPNVSEADFDSPIICFTSPEHKAEDCDNCDYLLLDMYGISEVRLLPEIVPIEQDEKFPGMLELPWQR